MRLSVQIDAKGKTVIADETGSVILSKPLDPDQAAAIVGLVNVAPSLAATIEYALGEIQQLRIDLVKRLYLWNDTQAKEWLSRQPSPVVTRLLEALNEYREVTDEVTTEG